MALALPGGASAQSTTEQVGEENALMEVIVTARRQSESLQEVPLSVSVLDSDALREKNITNGNDLAQIVPGLNAANFQNRLSPAFSIRAQGEVYGVNQPGVVSYFAEVPGFTPFFYDLSSVQVLKGPQGTLFGRNTTGGAILLTPTRPTQELDGFATVRFGSFNRADQEFAIGGALLPDKLAFRIAGQNLQRDGYTRELVSGKRLDDDDRYSLRGSVLFTPTENFENYTLFQYDRIEENGTGHVFDYFVPTAPFATELGPYLALQDERGPRKVQHEYPDFEKYLKRGVINTTTLQINDEFTLKNIYQYSKGGPESASRDIDGSPFRLVGVSGPTDPGHAESEEFQVQYKREAFNAVLGFYYESVENGFNDSVAPLSVVSPFFPFPLPVSVILQNDNSSVSRAGFTQMSWAFRPDTKVTLGFRRTFDQRDLHQATGLSIAGGPVDFNPPSGQPRTYYSTESNASTWTFALDHNFTDDLMSYVTVRRGYKAGGLNAIADTSRIEYDPEFVTDYEVGLKSEWDIGAAQLRANVAVFHDEYKDIQRSVTPPVLPGQVPVLSVANAAKAKVDGFDLDLAMATSTFFSATLQYTYLKPKYDHFTDLAFGDLKDGQFPNSPKHQFSITPAAHLPLPDTWGSLSASATLFYQSETALIVNNVLNGTAVNDLSVPASRLPAYGRLDMRLDWRDVNDWPLTLSVYARNVLDRDYQVGGVNSLSSAQIGVADKIYGAPRMYVFEAHYEF